MENPVRRADYLASMERRRVALKIRLAGLLQTSTPFVWEIGCGHGHFLAAYAAAHPAEICVGIDLVGERVDRAVRKRDRAKLGNLHFLQADAGLFLETLPPLTVFSRLWILFPDPWPKVRHHKNRIVRPDFLAAIVPRAAKGATLCFRTDYTPYFRTTQAIFAKDPHWSVADEAWPFEYPTVFQSRTTSYHSLIAKLREPAS